MKKTETMRMLFLCLFFSLFCACNEIIVTKTADTNDGVCTETDCSLREAIIAANNTLGTDKIILRAGTYPLTRTGADEDISDTGDLDILSAVNIEGAGQETTIIDGNFTDRVLDIHGGMVSLENLTVRHGRTGTGGAGVRVLSGGGIDLRKVEISGNQESGPEGPAVSNSPPSMGMGAGLYSEGNVTAVDVVFRENQNIKRYEPGFAHGAGMYVSGPRANINDYTGSIVEVRLENVRFYNNRVVNSGGGIYIASYANVTLRNLDMEHNGSYTDSGGAIAYFPFDEPESTHLEIHDSNIYDNYAFHDGSGLYLRGNAQVYRTALRDNEAGGSGGGVYASGEVLLRDCTIDHNIAAGYGGGVYSHSGVSMENVTLSANEAAFGGGMHVNSDAPIIRNSTIAYNEAVTNGGGLSVSLVGTVEIVNTIIAENNKNGASPAFELNNCHVALLEGETFPEFSRGYNLANDDTCGFFAEGDRIAEPVLGILADHGGPTMTHALLPGSPAIDHGTNYDCTQADQRGFPRPAIGELGVYITDIGSYEAQ